MTGLQGWMNVAEWRATSDMPDLPASDDGLANVTDYAGVTFRSALEASWACTLDHLGIAWEYEPWLYRAPSGLRYLPDFWLPAVRTFIEVKGEHMQRSAKPQELAERIRTDDIIVLIGFPPQRVSYSPYCWESKMKWQDPLGYDTRLALCPHCSAWQWMRAQLSRQCRACGDGHFGLLARSGEMPFYAEPESRSERAAAS